MGTADPPRVNADDVVGVEDTSDRVSTRQALLRIAAHGILGALVLTGFTKFTSAGFDAQVRQFPRQVATEKPQVVVIGNSMAREGVDAPMLSEALERRVTKLTVDGSMSAFWYVCIKNVIAAGWPVGAPQADGSRLRKKPEAVVLCFRDQHLTAPTFMLTGSSALAALSLAHPDGEPVLDELAMKPALGPVKYAAFKYWPLFRARESAQLVTNRRFLNRVLSPLLGLEKRALAAAFYDVLSDRNMDHERINEVVVAGTSLRDLASLDFAANVEQSFLPPICDELEAAGVRLVVVRMKRLRTARGFEPPEELSQYARDLQAYVEGRGGIYLDYSTDLRVPLDWFGVGDHFHAEGRRGFTKILGEELAPLLERPR